MSSDSHTVGDGYTIGEVLNKLKEDFEDITISKIRFLESEGLVHPDRTESGYRKFTDDDVDRLRFILTAQRDHYLPLKVIREQLDRLDAGEVAAGQRTPDQLGQLEISGPDGRLPSGPAQAPPVPLDQPPPDNSMGVQELAEATGLDTMQIRALRDFGVLGDRDDNVPFSEDDLEAARAARDLLQLGLEPRHLRMYRHFVERELALFEQLVSPALRQRNPEARRQAAQQLEALSQLTTRLQSSLLSKVLRHHLHGH